MSDPLVRMGDMANLDWLRQKFQLQYAHINRAQALQSGLTSRQIDLYLDRRDWLRVHRSVYRDANAPDQPEQPACAALLWGGKGCALSHQTAAWLWRLEGFDNRPAAVQLSAPRSVTRAPQGIELFCRVHFASELALHRGLRLTNLPQTLVDLASILDETTLELALDSAHRNNRNLEGWLRAWFRRHGTERIAGARELLKLVDQRTNRYTDSHNEVLFRRAFRRLGLPSFIFGYVVRHNGKRIMRVDAASPSLKIAIHIDSWRWHGSARVRQDNDASQRSELDSIGWSNQIVTSKMLRTGEWIRPLRALVDRKLAEAAARAA